MHLNRVKAFCYCILLLICFTNVISYSKADLASVKYTGTGGFFPAENCPLIMTNANVIFEIDYNEPSNRIDISFEGNYTIYNPNESQNITVAAPFSSVFESLESTFKIKVNNSQKPFTFYDYHWSDPWAEYLDTIEFSSLHSFILTNISIGENSSVRIDCSFDSYIIPSINDDDITIMYNLGTSRTWNGTITESVEFNTYGKLPSSCYIETFCPDNYSFTITNFSDGRSYKWEWIDTRINTNAVFVSYYFPNNRSVRMSIIFTIFSLYISIPIVIGIIIKIVKKKRKSE